MNRPSRAYYDRFYMVKAPILVIVGETASGKSALALELAKKFNGEIINADSSALRSQADIGTAKPSEADRSAVKHHLIDVIGPDEKFTAAQFKQLAEQSIQDITSRGKLPVMVGGSGLYIDSVIYDYSFSGKGQSNDRHEMISGVLVIGLKTDREELKKRIAARTDAMLQAGLEAEVKKLVERFGWGCEALRAIGYSEWKGYFEGHQSLHETRQKMVKDTLDLAKRQRTWFKRNKSIQWFATPVNTDEVVASVTTFLSK